MAGIPHAHCPVSFAHVQAAGVGIRVDRDGAQAELCARAARHSQCDLAAVGDEQCVESILLSADQAGRFGRMPVMCLQVIRTSA